MEKFNSIYQRAAERKGGETMLQRMLSVPRSREQLATLSDNQWLEEFTKKVFQSGFYWQVIENKWPGFREVFWQFDVNGLLMMSPEQVERAASDERIVRNYKKVLTVQSNALMIRDVAEQHGSFAQFVAAWPEDNIVGLWQYLKKHGARLGGNTGVYALRVLGKDTFILSRDVEAYLRAHKLIEGGTHSQKSLQAAQATFNQWQQESGLPLQTISQVVAFSVGDNNLIS
jgi:3-methyladenine DNA glycosylase Tag